MVEMSPESHAVPVELVSGRADQCPRRSAAARTDKTRSPTPTMDEPPLPPFADAEPAPDAADAADQDHQAQDRSRPARPAQDQETAGRGCRCGAEQDPGPGPELPKNAKAGDRASSRARATRRWPPPTWWTRSRARFTDAGVRRWAPPTPATWWWISICGSIPTEPSWGGHNYLETRPRRWAIPIPAPRRRRPAGRSINARPIICRAKRYSEWREINPFRFDPRQMMGQ